MAIPIPGLEAIHTWAGVIALQDLDQFPRYKVKRIGGLRSRADADDNRAPAQGRPGENVYPSMMRGKTVTYEGEIQALDLNSMRQAGDALLAAFDGTDERVMTMVYHPSYAPGAGSPGFFFTGRCIQADAPEEQTAAATQMPTGFVRPFVIGIRLSDRRIYLASPASATSSPFTSSGGGITPPITPPIDLGAIATGGEISVFNPGTAASDPIFTLYGPATNPRLEHLGTGRKLRLYNFILPTVADWVTIDFRSRTVLYQGVTDYRSKIDIPASDWWDEGAEGLPSGQNSIFYRGDVIADPAHADLSYYPAST